MNPDVQKTAPTAPRVELLDLLRLFAVLGVVVYHFGFWGPSSHGEILVALPGLRSVAMYGYLGVSVFFVISGFVIAYSAEGRTATGFAIARFSRIYPTFIFCMTLTFSAILIAGVPRFDATLEQWAGNLAVAAPMVGQPYMDSAYWSLVVEIVFYVWVSVLIGCGLFPRRIDTLVLLWLGISIANELTVDAVVMEKVFLADDSGFFATGLLIYEHYRGRRDTVLYALLALAIGTATFQAVHKLGHLTQQNIDLFDQWVAAAITLASIAVIFLATRLRNIPLPAGVIAGAGGLTYPFYLLHQKLGYVTFYAIGPAYPVVTATLIVIAIALLSWAIWRYVERQVQQRTKTALTALASRLGWPSRVTSLDETSSEKA